MQNVKDRAKKKTYTQPKLVTHGSVQKLTEHQHKKHTQPNDCGSSLPFGKVR